MKKLFKQIARFTFVGGTAFVIDFAILWLFTELGGMNYLVSNCISFTVSTIYNYVMSIYWVFDVNNKRSNRQNFLVFIIMSIVGMGISQFVMMISTEKIGINYLFSKIFATLIVMVYNFIKRKMFLETKETDKPKGIQHEP